MYLHLDLARPAGSTSPRCREGSRRRARSWRGRRARSTRSSSTEYVTSGRFRRARSTASATISRAVRPPAHSVLLGSRKLDELRDQRRHLAELLDDVREQTLALAGRQRSVAGEHLDVRPQARQRRSQLVRRVRDELPLRARRLLERAEHRVEARREPAQLVACPRRRSARTGRCVSVTRLGRARQPA